MGHSGCLGICWLSLSVRVCQGGAECWVLSLGSVGWGRVSQYNPFSTRVAQGRSEFWVPWNLLAVVVVPKGQSGWGGMLGALASVG